MDSLVGVYLKCAEDWIQQSTPYEKACIVDDIQL